MLLHAFFLLLQAYHNFGLQGGTIASHSVELWAKIFTLSVFLFPLWQRDAVAAHAKLRLYSFSKIIVEKFQFYLVVFSRLSVVSCKHFINFTAIVKMFHSFTIQHVLEKCALHRFTLRRRVLVPLLYLIQHNGL